MKEYKLSKSHTGKGYCIYRVEKNVHTPVAYIKKSAFTKKGELEKLIANNFH